MTGNPMIEPCTRKADTLHRRMIMTDAPTDTNADREPRRLPRSLLAATVVIVDQTESVFVTEFGRPVRLIEQPGCTSSGPIRASGRSTAGSSSTRRRRARC